MKHIFSVLLILCLLLVPMAGPVSADDHEPPPTQSSALPAPVISTPDEPDLVEFEPGSVPAAAAPMEAISLPIHALVLSMLEQGLLYDEQSDLFVWNALFYTLSMYGEIDGRACLTQDALMVPSELVQDYLSALFASRSELPDIPAALADRVRYDPQTDHYLLALGDFGLDELRIDSTRREPGGLCVLNGSLISPPDNTCLCRFQVRLAENDSMFGFSILELVIL